MASSSDGETPSVRKRATTLGEAAAQWAVSRWADVEGRRLRYRDAGSGIPLVLVHGLGVSADYWVRNATVIAAAGFRVLAPDLPGFGRTDGPPGGLDVPAQVDALRRWRTALAVGPAVYLGHSLSCQTVLQLAADHPDEVLGLVLAAPTGEGAGTRRLIRQAIGLARDLRRESIALAMLVAQAYFRAGPRRVLRTWQMAGRHDPMPLLPRIAAPTAIIIGDNDPVVDLDFGQQMARALPAGHLVVVPGGSHAVIFDSTGTFNGAVVGLMREVAGRGGNRGTVERETRSRDDPSS
ncbi:MAG TPA: alpha/beta hydrolase [Longimicrobiaceae bacterium]|nr:alpha/beta hydrolase [Longimicrobiaceae bacterium]